MATVFIVDDDGFVARIYEVLLREDGHLVHCFTAACEALDTIGGGTIPDVIVADLEMPHMDGAEFARAIKGDGALRDIPILLYSASSGLVRDEDRHLFFGLYQKPLRPDEVQGSVRSALTPPDSAHTAT